MPLSTVLIAEDDRKTAELIRLYLERNGYEALVVYDGRQALDLARRQKPDLMVLDLMLPGMDGLDICRVLRAESNLAIIMLTARSTEEDKLFGLELGADDYITKPFSPRELVARVKTVLRRSQAEIEPQPTIIEWEGLRLDAGRHQVWLQSRPVALTAKEFRLLQTLAESPGRVFSRVELLEKAFGLDYDGLERTIDVHILKLRKKLEADPENPIYIQTVYGVGYKFGGQPPTNILLERR